MVEKHNFKGQLISVLLCVPSVANF